MHGINIGTAGWSIPLLSAESFPSGGSALERYAARLSVTEINSSFHRPHRRSTWEKWRDSVPEAFRFSVKIPKTITHQSKLRDCGSLIDAFLSEAAILEGKLAVLLVQLPPKLDLDPEVASAFFTDLTAKTEARIACEPRNVSWFTEEADRLLAKHGVARVAADPAICDAARQPGGWPGLSYMRLHGSPVIYRSSYADRIADYASQLAQDQAPERWCVFDNTASSAALGDALALDGLLTSADSL